MEIINPATKEGNSVMPDLIRHPVPTWIPAFAGMTILSYLIAGAIPFHFVQEYDMLGITQLDNRASLERGPAFRCAK
jgi:hypothetical protein